MFLVVIGKPAASSPITKAIQFSSVMDSGSRKVEINCKNSVKHVTIDESGSKDLSCPVNSDYWLKHLILLPEQQTTLEFVPGYALQEAADWCWSCDFDWGSHMVPEMLIFPNHTAIESPWTNEDDSLLFQVRPTGIYQRVRYGQDNEFEMYVLAGKWVPKDEFQCTQAGKFRDPYECNKFHVCEALGTGFVHNKFTCPEAATVYCEETDTCGYEFECPCLSVHI